MKRTPGWTKDGGQFVPSPLVYLNQRRWEGAEATPAASGGWWQSAGFANVYEAHNAQCFEHNAAEFRDGKRLELEL